MFLLYKNLPFYATRNAYFTNNYADPPPVEFLLVLPSKAPRRTSKLDADRSMKSLPYVSSFLLASSGWIRSSVISFSTRSSDILLFTAIISSGERPCQPFQVQWGGGGHITRTSELLFFRYIIMSDGLVNRKSSVQQRVHKVVSCILGLTLARRCCYGWPTAAVKEKALKQDEPKGLHVDVEERVET